MAIVENLKNKKFGRLKVLKEIGRDNNGSAIWRCKCDCGNTKDVPAYYLKNGWTQSCGCLGQESKGKYNRMPHGIAARNSLYRRYKEKALKRKIQFDLTMEEFEEITHKKCHYCGIEPYREHKIKNKTGIYLYNGIDRVDNTKGYIRNNVVPCCKYCNQAKSDLTTEKFRKLILRIENYWLLNEKI